MAVQMHLLDGNQIEIMCRLQQALQKEDEVVVFFYAGEEERRRLSWYQRFIVIEVLV